MPANDGVATAIKRVQTAAKMKAGKLLAALRTDCGGEFSAANFNKYCAHLGVNHERSTPYSPQQNEVVDRRNQTIMTAARCMLKAK
jgi:transposase InsO family protein